MRRRRRRRSDCRGPTDDGPRRRPPRVPRRPAEGVLRLTTARARRISLRTWERSSQQAVWVTALVYDNASGRSSLRSRPPTAPNCPGSTRGSVPRSTGTEGVGLPGHHPRLKNVAGINRTRPSTTMRTAGRLSTVGVASTVTLHDHAHHRWPGSPGFCKCGTYVTAIAPRWCTAVEVTDDARPQRPSPKDEPYDTCTETARD